MPATRLPFVLFLAAAGGCADPDWDARRLLDPSPAAGRMHLAAQGDDRARGQVDQCVRVRTADECEIDAWVVRSRSRRSGGFDDAPPAKGTVLVLHPLSMSKSWFLPLGKTLAGRGWDVVLPDLRGHGRSGGQYVTWGAKEKFDLKELMDKLIAEKTVCEPVYVFGASMGGCVAVQYAAIDDRCRGVLAVAPPTGLRGGAVLKMPFADSAHIVKVLIRAGEIGGFDPESASATEAATLLRCPLVLVHGKFDMVVPVSHSQAIHDAAAGDKKLIVLPWADHGSVQVGRDDWFADQLDELARMPRTPAPRPLPETRGAAGTP